ncbi:hypothetical protein EDD16DRAFT_1637818 [Pisolithus croceorrhizus]|nr:hypothetical protein EDD16DRAFT_1637818 [Pisolithus croceorrhizus]
MLTVSSSTIVAGASVVVANFCLMLDAPLSSGDFKLYPLHPRIHTPGLVHPRLVIRVTHTGHPSYHRSYILALSLSIDLMCYLVM